MVALKTDSDLPNYGAILWDNDGVLVDTERWYFQATREVFAAVGVDLTVELYFEYFLSRSKGTSKFASAHGLSEGDIAEIQGARNERYLHMLEQEWITIVGVRETLAIVRPHFVMGIVTSSRRQHFETMHRRTSLLEFLTLQSRLRITHELSQRLIRISPQSLAVGCLLADASRLRTLHVGLLQLGRPRSIVGSFRPNLLGERRFPARHESSIVLLTCPPYCSMKTQPNKRFERTFPVKKERK